MPCPGISSTVGGVRDGEAEPHAGDWVPDPALTGMKTMKAKALGVKVLKKRRPNVKRGLIGGKRSVAMWKTQGDDTYLIELHAGDHVQRIRLSEDTLDAIEELRAESKGQHMWKLVYRVLTTNADTSHAAADPGGPRDPKTPDPSLARDDQKGSDR